MRRPVIHRSQGKAKKKKMRKAMRFGTASITRAYAVFYLIGTATRSEWKKEQSGVDSRTRSGKKYSPFLKLEFRVNVEKCDTVLH
jgi:hypothetical protein